MNCRTNLWTPAAAGLVVLFLCCIGAKAANAQDDPNRPVLPDIAPRVVEIRGQLEISLPTLERQPLMGFNPPPPVAVIPPERRPFIEEYKQESIDLPPSPLQAPEPPSVASLIGRQPRNGILEAAAGRYFSRAVRVRTEWPLGDPTAIYSKLDYEGSDGHTPFEDRPEAHDAYETLDALVGLQYVGEGVTAGVELDGFLNQYDLFASERVVSLEPPDREGRGGGIAAFVRTPSASNVDLEGRVRYASALYSTDASGAEDETIDSEESSLEADVDLRLALGNTAQSVVGDVHFTGLGRDDDGIAGTVQMLDAGAGMRIIFARGLDLTARGRLMTFAAEDHKIIPGGGAEGAGDGTYLGVDVAANLYPAEGVRLFVENRPHAEHHTMASLYRDAPYLVDQPVVQPTIYTIDARGGGQLVRGAFEAELFGGYQRAPNFLYFTRSDNFESYQYGNSLISTNFAEAEIIRVGGAVSVNLPAGFNATVGLTVRDGRLTDEDTDIPYFGPLVGRGSVSYSFADGRGFIQATGRYESARYVDIPDARRLGDFFDLDLEGSYNFSPALGAVVRFQNLSAGYLERWEGHDRASFVLMGGLRVRW